MVMGYKIKYGNTLLLDGNLEVIAITKSTLFRKGKYFVFRPLGDGKWDPKWEDESTFPVKAVQKFVKAFHDNKENISESGESFLVRSDLV